MVTDSNVCFRPRKLKERTGPKLREQRGKLKTMLSTRTGGWRETSAATTVDITFCR